MILRDNFTDSKREESSEDLDETVINRKTNDFIANAEAAHLYFLGYCEEGDQFEYDPNGHINELLTIEQQKDAFGEGIK